MTKQAKYFSASGVLLFLISAIAGGIAANTDNNTLEFLSITAGIIGSLLFGVSIGLPKKEK